MRNEVGDKGAAQEGELLDDEVGHLLVRVIDMEDENTTDL